MAFQYLTNIPLKKAQEDYLLFLKEHGLEPKTESIPVVSALNRITCAPVYAHISAPHYPASAMDGIAVWAADTYGATETTPVILDPDQYVVVDTGDPVPDGCDAVIMVEELVNEENNRIRIHQSAAPWQHIRQIGEDICAGEMILPANTKISPAAIGSMLAGGVMEVSVHCRPVVGIIPTGDEIIDPIADPKPGDILEFNSSVFSAMLTDWGAFPVRYPIVPDKRDEILDTLKKAVSECDCVLLNAGSSAGREDYSVSVIRELGEVLYHGIAIKPGKPAILGCCEGTPVIGVPGYPVSGIIVLEQLLRPVIEHLCGLSLDNSQVVRATLTKRIVSGLKYQEFVRVRMGYVGDKLIATPLPRGAGIISSFMKADGLVAVPLNSEGLDAGMTVPVHLMRPLKELRHTLVAIGSHDPLLDELANMLHQADPNLYMSSNHVGSMGGIMAIKRKEAHIGGCHLLDESDGSYNYVFIRKHFPQGGVHLIECVGRQQGLMVAKGNPLGFTGFSDITKEGVRFVNRQKGSGTRILNDYLCKQNGIDPDSIYGYEREEFTHTSVAIQIASGTADCGMGIYSAAQLYDLDFIPVCIEQYDLIISDDAWETPMVKQLLKILQSEKFRTRAEEMGGYTLEHPGKERLF